MSVCLGLAAVRAGIDQVRVTQHVLVECLDIRSILEAGNSVEDVSAPHALFPPTKKVHALVCWAFWVCMLCTCVRGLRRKNTENVWLAFP